ncbi:MAG: hypothetical protein IJ448_03220 [Oscillospiraceae bacterium]|nr:hypothetical protein [Oscillospiraceae bacterium]
MKSYKKYREAVACVKAPKDIKQAVLRIPDSYEQSMPAPRRHGWVRLAAMAAVIAIIIGVVTLWPGSEENYITGPGLLSIRAYALDEREISEANSTVLKEGVELPWNYAWSPGINVVRGLPIQLDFPDECFDDAIITLQISTTGGSFYGEPVRYLDPISQKYGFTDHPLLGSSFSAANHSKIYWFMNSGYYDPNTQKYVFSDDIARGSSYVDIVIQADGQIVGYAVVEVYELSLSYKARVVEMASFPKIDGEYQFVTMDYMSKLFKEIHERK